MNLTDSFINHHKTGDIILTKSKVGGDAIVKAQRTLLKERDAKSGHVLICVIPGVFAESTMGKAIGLFFYTDDRISLKSDIMMILRNSEVSKSISLQGEIRETIRYQLGKKYSVKGLLLIEEENAEFDLDKGTAHCVEFVSNVYKRINEHLKCPVFDKPTNKIYPVHIEKLPQLCSNWRDVSTQYFAEGNAEDRDELIEEAKEYIDSQYLMRNSVDTFNDVVNSIEEFHRIARNIDLENMTDRQLKALGKSLKTAPTDAASAYDSILTKIGMLNSYSENPVEAEITKLFWNQKKVDSSNNLERDIFNKAIVHITKFIELQLKIVLTIQCSFRACISFLNQHSEKKTINGKEKISDLLNMVQGCVHLTLNLPFDNIEQLIRKLNQDSNTRNELKEIKTKFASLLDNIRRLNNLSVKRLFVAWNEYLTNSGTDTIDIVELRNLFVKCCKKS